MGFMKSFLSAAFAGFAIGMGGVVYLSTGGRTVGAFLFAVGLLTICSCKLNLFTGMVCYLPERGRRTAPELITVWLGNFVGAAAAAALISVTRWGKILYERASEIAAVKLGDGFWSLLILGTFCGMLIFIAVDTFRRNEGSFFAIAVIFVCIPVFILSGFEHSIANMFFFVLARAPFWQLLGAVLIVTLGNSIGGLLIPVVRRFTGERE